MRFENYFGVQRELCRALGPLWKKHFFLQKLAGIGKKYYLCRHNQQLNLPIDGEYGIYIS